MKNKSIVINNCFGGFGLSHEAIMEYAKLKRNKLYYWADESTKRIYKTDNVDELIKQDALSINYTKVPQEEYERLSEEEKNKPISPKRFLENPSTSCISLARP